MKHIDTWITEKDYKNVKKHMAKSGVTLYSLTQDAIRAYTEKQSKQEQEEETRTSIVFGFIIYSLAATAFILLF